VVKEPSIVSLTSVHGKCWSYITSLEERAGIYIDIIQHCQDDQKSEPHISIES